MEVGEKVYSSAGNESKVMTSISETDFSAEKSFSILLIIQSNFYKKIFKSFIFIFTKKNEIICIIT